MTSRLSRYESRGIRRAGQPVCQFITDVSLMSLAPGNIKQWVFAEVSIQRRPQLPVGDTTVSRARIGTVTLPAIVAPDGPPMVTTLDDMRRIRPDRDRTRVRVFMYPPCGIQCCRNFHRIVRIGVETARLACNSVIAIKHHECPATPFRRDIIGAIDIDIEAIRGRKTGCIWSRRDIVSGQFGITSFALRKRPPCSKAVCSRPFMTLQSIYSLLCA